MPLIDLRSSTFGYGASSGALILAGHLRSLIRSMTMPRFLNLIRAETNRLLGRAVVGSMPYYLKIETTGICNLDCRWCTGSRRKRTEEEREPVRMTESLFREILDQTGKYLFRINLYGFGEPLLFPETFSMIRAASDRNISVAVSSNMNINSESITKDILDSGLEQLIFSCHGTTDETVREFMGQSADIGLAMGNIRKLVRERKQRGSRYPVITWQYCVTGFNEAQINEARKLAEEICIDGVRFIKPWFPPGVDAKWYSSLFPARSVEATERGTPGCSWPWRGCYISCDGGYLPCCREELFPENDFGNLKEKDFSAIWNGERCMESRKLIKNPETYIQRIKTICSNCPELGFKPRTPNWPE